MLNVLMLSKNRLLDGGVGEVLRQLCRRLPRYGVRPILYNPHPNVVPFSEEEGIPHYRSLLTPGWGKPMAHLSACRHILAIARKERIDVSHAHAVGSPLRSSLVLQDHLGIPAVVTSHGEITPAYRNRERWSLHRTLRTRRWLARAAAITHLNEAMRSYAIAFSNISSTSVIIPNGCDVKWWRDIASPQLPDPKCQYILTLGRLDPIKGLEGLLNAYNCLMRCGLRISLVFAGEGSERVRLRSKARELGIPVYDELKCLFDAERAGVCFSGNIAGKLKKEVMQKCLFLAHPNRSTEAFGLVIVEAMAAGKAVVCFDMPTYRGLVADKVNGLVVPLGDDTRFVEALIDLIVNAEARKKYEMNNLSAAMRYDWDDITMQYANLYLDLESCYKKSIYDSQE